MAKFDIQVLQNNSVQTIPSRPFATAAGAVDILPGEMVKVAGAYVEPIVTGDVVAGAEIVGVTVDYSDHTATEDGKVEVNMMMEGTEHVIAALDPLAIETQAQYDALVNSGVNLDVTAGVITVDTAAAGSVIVRPSNIEEFPGKVRVIFESAVSNLA